MAIMDYMPTFGGNTAPMQETALPADDTAMQLELKRRLKMAEALQQQAGPEGQMVSGHYVAPSWTQYLANAYGKYQGGKQEREALGQFGEYQKGKQAKLANLLTDLQQGKETKTYDNTPYQIQIPSGEAPQTENLGAMQPYNNGMKTIDVPMTNTSVSYKPYSQKEFMAKVGSTMPDMLPKMLESQFAQYAAKKPIELGAGAKLVNPDTYAVLAENPKQDGESTSTLEKEYNFMKRKGYAGSAQDYFDMKQRMTDKERNDLDIKLKQLGIDQAKLYYDTGIGNPPAAPFAGGNQLKPGTVVNGFKYNGGNPNQQSSWSK
jgi:hypothetical protein